jgi:lipopolysaccharide/colanic/teichoic acid biosynthesis glycosyltransferase
MSLVGPRPMMLEQRQFYHGQCYFDLRPGITGLWQVSDRNDTAFVDRVRYDNIYDRRVSLFTDIAILLRTVGVVLRRTGY